MFKQLFFLFLFTFAGIQAARIKQTYNPEHSMYNHILTEQINSLSFVLKNKMGKRIPITGDIILRMLAESRSSDEMGSEKIVVKTDTATGKTDYKLVVQLKF